MRCIGCGAQMVLTAAVPDETMAVQGFEHQTFRCFDCGAMEQRHTFVAGNPASAEVTAPAPISPPTACIEEAPAANDTVSGAWTRAVEKLRSRQAEIRQRAEAAKRTDWNLEFNQAWERLAPGRPASAENGYSDYTKPKDLREMFARTVRSRLRQTAATAAGRNRAATPIPQPSPQAAQEFKRFWDSLAPGNTPLLLQAESPSVANGASEALLPLPRSLSLVLVETPAAASAAARAISLLRGPLAA
jgi:hypothetical protein